MGESAGGYARLLEPPDGPSASPYISASLLMPALMKAKEKANRTKCSSKPRTMTNGELQLCEVDFVIPERGLDFVWARTYRSRTGTNTVMGQNWSHSYDIAIWSDATGHLDLADGSGRMDRYYSSTGGVWTADELFNVITETGGVFTVTFPDSSFWEFNSFSNPSRRDASPVPWIGTATRSCSRMTAAAASRKSSTPWAAPIVWPTDPPAGC